MGRLLTVRALREMLGIATSSRALWNLAAAGNGDNQFLSGGVNV